MQKNTTILYLSLVLTSLFSVGVLFLETPSNWAADNLEFHLQLIINIVVAMGHATGAVLFLANLDVYKAKLKRAYALLAVGAVLTGIGTLQISLLTLFSLWETPYGQSGAIMLPFLLSGLTLYISVRSFARLVGVHHFLLNSWLTLPIAFVFAALSTLLPHAANPLMTEMEYDLLVGVSVWSGVFMLFASYLTLKVQQFTGRLYTHAMIWLKRALAMSAFVLIYVGIYTLVYVHFVEPVVIVNNLTAVVSGLIWVRAGYAFAATKYYTASSKRSSDQSTPPVTSVIDMVTSTAELVSNINDIDRSLDKVRIITSKLKPGEKPSTKDVSELVTVYLELEDYLTTKEPIRTFSTQELRARFSPSIRKLISSSHP